MPRMSGVTVLSTADLLNPIWTNKQFIAAGLSERNAVTYIDSLGLRRPTLGLSDLKRIVRRMLPRRSGARRRQLPRSVAGIRHIRPRVFPFHRHPLFRVLNAFIFKRSVLSLVPTDERQVLWTFSPLTYGLEKHFDRVVYHSVDLLHTFPGAPSDLLLKLERQLVRRADEVIVSSRGLAEHVNSLGRSDVRLWENVAETGLFANSALSGARPNRVIFSGNMTPTKVDFDLLFATAELGCELYLAGPVAVDGTDSREKLDALLAHPKVTYLGILPLRELASEVGKSRVGLIPYVCNDHTDGIFPMKVYEYVAGDCFVVSTPLKSLQAAHLPAGVILAERGDFVEVVRRMLLDHASRPAGSGFSMSSDNSWEFRIAEAQRLVEALSAIEPAGG